MSTKHILFYSNYCPYSKEVLQTITKKNLSSAFVLVCVDHGKYELPPFVDRVPIIVACTQESKIVLKDDTILSFLNSTGNAGSSSSGSGALRELDPIDWFSYKVGYSDGFSYLEDENAPSGGQGLMYACIGSENQHIDTPPEINATSTSKTSGVGSVGAGGPYGGRGNSGVNTRDGNTRIGSGGDLEKLIEQRTQDIQRIIGFGAHGIQPHPAV